MLVSFATRALALSSLNINEKRPGSVAEAWLILHLFDIHIFVAALNATHRSNWFLRMRSGFGYPEI